MFGITGLLGKERLNDRCRGEYMTGASHQQFEQLKLARSELDRFTTLVTTPFRTSSQCSTLKNLLIRRAPVLLTNSVNSIQESRSIYPPS